MIDFRALTFDQIPAAIGWLLIVWGVSTMVLGSLPAEEIRRRIAAYGQTSSADLRLAQWELASGYRWHPALAQGDEMAPKVPLTPAELGERRTRLEAVQRQFWWKKPLLYFLGCDFCKAAWTALALWLFNGRGTGWFLNMAGYAIAIVVLSNMIPGRQSRRLTEASRPMSETGCGAR